jgi:hypothetical protein
VQTTLPTHPDAATHGKDPAPSLNASLARVGPPALLAGLLLLSALIVLPHVDEPIFDQKILLQADLNARRMPSPERGLTSELWVVAVRSVTDPAPAQLNAAVMGLAMAFYTIAATALAAAWLRRRELLAVFVLFLFASQLPFLWISVEVFAGGYLCLALLAWRRDAPPWLTGALLALFALAKPDLILMGGALAAFWAWRAGGRNALWLLGGFAATYALLVLPGLAIHGLDYYRSWANGEDAQGRAFIAFSDHFKRVVAHFQVAGPPPVPLEAYTQPYFGDAQSMWDVWTHPKGWFVYLEFVVLGALRGAVKGIYFFNWTLLAVPCLIWARRRGRVALDDGERSLLLCFIGLAPVLLITYPHIRYLARFWPLFLLLMLGTGERLLAQDAFRGRRPALALAGVFMTLGLGTLASRAAHNLRHVAAFDQYWFPD